MNGARFLVSGKVQGVWYRASTRERALALGLRGEARNLADGRVEVIAFGPPEALDSLERWLAVGPPQAQVTSVVREAFADERAFLGFGVG